MFLTLSIFPPPFEWVLSPIIQPLANTRYECHYYISRHILSFCCGLQTSELVRRISCFSLLVYHTVPSHTMKGRLQKGGFQARSSLNFLIPVSERCRIFRYRDLTSTSERHPRAIQMAYVVLGATWTTLANNGFLKSIYMHWKALLL